MKAGVMERRSDTYPDAAMLARMAQMYGGVVGAGAFSPYSYGGGSASQGYNAADRARQRYLDYIYGPRPFGGAGQGGSAGGNTGANGAQPGTTAGGDTGTGTVPPGGGSGAGAVPPGGSQQPGYVSSGTPGAPLPEAWMMYYGRTIAGLGDGSLTKGEVRQQVYDSLTGLGVDSRTAERLADSFATNPTLPNLHQIFVAQQHAPGAVKA